VLGWADKGSKIQKWSEKMTRKSKNMKKKKGVEKAAVSFVIPVWTQRQGEGRDLGASIMKRGNIGGFYCLGMNRGT